MRPANPRLVIARAAVLGFAALGCWSLVACAKTPAAGAQAEAADGAGEGGRRRGEPAARGQAALRQARRPGQEGLHPDRQQRVLGLRRGAEPASTRPRKTLPALGRARCATSPSWSSRGTPTRRSREKLAKRYRPVARQEDRRRGRADEGQPEREDHAGRVRRLRVPALQAVPAGAAPDPRRVPQRREALLQALPAAPAHQRAPAPPRRRSPRRSRASSGSSRTSCGRSRTS